MQRAISRHDCSVLSESEEAEGGEVGVSLVKIHQVALSVFVWFGLVCLFACLFACLFDSITTRAGVAKCLRSAQ